MIKFSVLNQAFYDDEFNYPELPNDLIEITIDRYYELLAKINQGCFISEDIAPSPPPPSAFHTWDGLDWVESRTPEQIEESKLKSLTSLTRRQFRRVLVQNGYDLDVIKAKILEIEDTQTRQLTLIDWEDANTFERLDTSLIMMAEMMGMSDDQVNAMWEQALTI